MFTDTRNPCAALLLLVSVSLPIMATAKDEACAGVSQKCTKDKTYDKTIDGTVYSCYDCKQALCKDGGNGGISGTATSSVCTAKATTFRPISLDDQARSGEKLAPTPVVPRRPGRAVDPRPAQFDEADALFSRRLQGAEAEQRGQRVESAQTARGHRAQSDRRTPIVEVADGTSNTVDMGESARTAPEHRNQSARSNSIVEIVDGTSKSRTQPTSTRDGKPAAAPADPNLLPPPTPAHPIPVPYPNQP